MRTISFNFCWTFHHYFIVHTDLIIYLFNLLLSTLKSSCQVFSVLRSLPAVSAPSLPEWEHPERDPRRFWHPSQTQHSPSKQRLPAIFISKSGVLQIKYLSAMSYLSQDADSRSGNWYDFGGHSAKHPGWWCGDTGQSRYTGRGMRSA